ncbi:MAG: hypothetical protein CSA62_09295 [Planctomycetota bacterium]|nr:MAG: hypothetical protein CSA62_09295 [Planctomycetota bacterium]
MHLDGEKLPPRLTKVARQELGLLRAEFALYLGYLLLPLTFALTWVLAQEYGLISSFREIALLVFGSFVAPPLLARLLVRLDAADFDERIGARGALLAWLTRPGCLAGEFLRRDLELLARGTSIPARQGKRLHKLLTRLLLFLLLFLLFSLFLPGHAPGAGLLPGASQGRESSAGGSGRKGEGEAQREQESGGAPEQAAAQKENPLVEQVQGKPAATPGEHQPEPAMPELSFRDLVVFPDFREGDRKARRDTGEIQRSPLAQSGSRQQQSRKRSFQQPSEARQLALEWQRQRERALRRGQLKSWEGLWLRRYGELLEAGK